VKRGVFAERYVEPQIANKEFARTARGIGGRYTHPESLTDSTIDMYFQPLVSSSARKRQLDQYTVALGTNVLKPVRENLSHWKKPARIVRAMQDSFFGVEWGRVARPHNSRITRCVTYRGCQSLLSGRGEGICCIFWRCTCLPGHLLAKAATAVPRSVIAQTNRLNRQELRCNYGGRSR
jgi:hypothetical protein